MNFKSPISDKTGIVEWIKNKKSVVFQNNHKGKTFYQVYVDIKNELESIQRDTEKGAMAVEIGSYLQEIRSKLEKIGKLPEGERNDQIYNFAVENNTIFLNNHGPEHCDKVILRINQILSYFEGEFLSSYEVFLLLCAIQMHDIGNILGREGHEVQGTRLLDQFCAHYIPDSVERSVIKRIASVHGGKYNGDKDTITRLPEVEHANGIKVRYRLLAALLRFGDELADDSERADNIALKLGIITDSSLIFHEYSRVLHTVLINKCETNYITIELRYTLDINTARRKFKYGSCEKYLIDEIYDRTLKMERERRYCMRFFRPYIQLQKIKVSIQIMDEYYTWILDEITFTLEDIGYPVLPQDGTIKIISSDMRSGEEEIQYLARRLINE